MSTGKIRPARPWLLTSFEVFPIARGKWNDGVFLCEMCIKQAFPLFFRRVLSLSNLNVGRIGVRSAGAASGPIPGFRTLGMVLKRTDAPDGRKCGWKPLLLKHHSYRGPKMTLPCVFPFWDLT